MNRIGYIHNADGSSFYPQYQKMDMVERFVWMLNRMYPPRIYHDPKTGHTIAWWPELKVDLTEDTFFLPDKLEDRCIIAIIQYYGGSEPLLRTGFTTGLAPDGVEYDGCIDHLWFPTPEAAEFHRTYDLEPWLRKNCGGH